MREKIYLFGIIIVIGNLNIGFFFKYLILNFFS